MSQAIYGLDPKWVALIALVFQNSGLAIAMRYTFVTVTGSDRYISSTAVINAEILKFIISSCASFAIDGNMNIDTFKKEAYPVLVENSNDWFKLMVPAVLYTLQNSLQYFSMSMLSAPVFQVLYQMKIITTAFFSVLILSKHLSTLQWVSVVALACGVALVQLSQSSGGADEHTNSFLGLISVLCACMTSGFAGVYFEMVLKSSKASIWLRNIQLSLIGIVTGLLSCYYRDGDLVAEKGFLVGYTNMVWTVIFLQAAGGLIVAIVVKYADNILKGFATSLSILLSCLVSVYYFQDMDTNVAFVVGTCVVLTSVYLYGYKPPVGGTGSSSSPNGSKEKTLAVST